MKIKEEIKKWCNYFKKNKGVVLQFKNASIENILSLRVVISDEVHEFRNLFTGSCTAPLFLKESQLYFFSYIVTQRNKFYYEPFDKSYKKKIKKGKIIISIYFVADINGDLRVLMYPDK